jgi:hypothetical protein
MNFESPNKKELSPEELRQKERERLERQLYNKIVGEEKTKARERLLEFGLITKDDPIPLETMEQLLTIAKKRWIEEKALEATLEATEEVEDAEQDLEAKAEALTYKGGVDEKGTHHIPEQPDLQKVRSKYETE